MKFYFKISQYTKGKKPLVNEKKFTYTPANP